MIAEPEQPAVVAKQHITHKCVTKIEAGLFRRDAATAALRAMQTLIVGIVVGRPVSKHKIKKAHSKNHLFAKFKNLSPIFV